MKGVGFVYGWLLGNEESEKKKETPRCLGLSAGEPGLLCGPLTKTMGAFPTSPTCCCFNQQAFCHLPTQ